ncbi:hypothetical protein SAMD00019534_006370 [Acytostelium subglobosum LB1]|uniref:hypothetical protein n=1 Tax=Acytostelium subglobosum LB1 TaxID=1410327 RepID=UPI000645093B|nr:hypothetical protein SAMD00019534_006370 [Acytostelium subglobosum LB1]GAM17462.1 hypothetical protein SAMD00019534_006370 [Acytostelium subglobosum LB1]|eukprot:XP_012759524.1 hypothetical protein SAMD00019534_006370 [Acytostelium subglobosum LB1]
MSTDTEFKPLASQIAGHTNDDPGSENIPGFLVTADGFVFKPVPGSRGKRELEFYKNYSTYDEDFKRFLARFDKVVDVKGTTYMGIEDLTFPFHQTKICVADVKMGTRTYDNDASEEKRANQILKSQKTTSSTLGIRFCGAKLYHPETNETVKLSKKWGKNLTKDNIKTEGIINLFSSGSGKVNVEAVTAFIAELKVLQSWFKKNTKYAFYGSSLLFVFGHVHEQHRKHHNVIMVSPEIGVSLKMIDFAHVDPLDKGALDESYLTGLENLIKLMQEVLDDAKK